MKRKFSTLAVAALMVFPFAVGGCVVGDDDDPDYVGTPSSTTVIDDDDNPDVNVTPAPNVTIEKDSPPVIIEKESPPPVNVDIRTDPPVIATTGG